MNGQTSNATWPFLINQTMLNKCCSRNRLSNLDSHNTITVLDNHGEIYEGNNAFYEVWSRLDGKTPLHVIIDIIQRKFCDTDPKIIQDDIVEIVNTMMSHGLVALNSYVSPCINMVDNRILAAHIAITSACNLHCNHCYLTDKDSTYISSKVFDSLLSDLANNGVLTVEISGGEPLMHKDFIQLLKCAKHYGFFIKLFTNATLINDDNVAVIAELVDSFRISLDGEKETHDSRRGNGSFQKTIHALHLLEGQDVQVSMTIDSNNCNDIPIVEQIVSQLGFRFELSPVVPYSHIALKHSDLMQIKSKIDSFLLTDTISSKRAFTFGVHCDAASRLIYINSQLDVSPCPLLSQKKWCFGNLKDHSLQVLLNSSEYKDILLTLEKMKSQCSSCNLCQFWCAAIIDQAPNRISPFCVIH